MRGECGKGGRSQVNVAILTSGAAIHDFHLDALVIVGDGGSQWNMALYAISSNTVDKAVSTNLRIPRNRGLNNSGEEAR